MEMFIRKRFESLPKRRNGFYEDLIYWTTWEVWVVYDMHMADMVKYGFGSHTLYYTLNL